MKSLERKRPESWTTELSTSYSSISWCCRRFHPSKRAACRRGYHKRGTLHEIPIDARPEQSAVIAISTHTHTHTHTLTDTDAGLWNVSRPPLLFGATSIDASNFVRAQDWRQYDPPMGQCPPPSSTSTVLNPPIKFNFRHGPLSKRTARPFLQSFFFQNGFHWNGSEMLQ